MPDTFTNPVIRGFYPDPSICRKGDDYFLICTTQEFFPALPVFHSRNLADWEQIGHVVSDPAKLDLDHSEDGQGVTAPTLRYYDGLFYAVSTLIWHDGDIWFIKSFVCTATDPAGPWSDPVFIEGAQGIDPSLFKDDDGKVYYHGNDWVRPPKTEGHRVIWAQEFDLEKMVLKGERKILLDAADWVDTYGKEGCVSFDGPHIYKKDGWYYLISAAGDTHWHHAIMAWRSKSVWGPYEPCPDNPIMTHRNRKKESARFACIGHMDVIDTPKGNYWGVFLGTRPHAGCYNYLGREAFLAPVDWSGDWPIISPGNDSIQKTYRLPLLPTTESREPKADKDKDDFKTESLGLEYLFIRRPQKQWWKTGDGKLGIALREPMLHEVANPSFIGRRLADMDFSAETEIDFNPGNGREEAGLVLYKSTKAYFRLVIRQTAGSREPKADYGDREIALIKRLSTDDTDIPVARTGLPAGPVELRIDTVNRCYRFSWRTPAGGWNVLDDASDVSCLAQTVVGGFTGILVGMFAGSNGQPSDNTASFNWFSYTGRDNR